MSGEVSDAAVIERSLSEPEVFGVIFDRHFEGVHVYLARRVGSGPADDLAASTFVVAFERRRRFHPDARSARPWLLGIATNLLRNHWRAEKRARLPLGEVDGVQPGQVSADSGEVARVGELLARLDRDQRDVLVLYAWEELSYEEIAAALGVPVGTVRSRLARARARLRGWLGEAPEEPSTAQEMG